MALKKKKKNLTIISIFIDFQIFINCKEKKFFFSQIAYFISKLKAQFTWISLRHLRH